MKNMHVLLKHILFVLEIQSFNMSKNIVCAFFQILFNVIQLSTNKAHLNVSDINVSNYLTIILIVDITIWPRRWPTNTFKLTQTLFLIES